MHLKNKIKSQLKKIMPKTMNFGLLNLTKQKKRSLGTQQNVPQKRSLGI